MHQLIDQNIKRAGHTIIKYISRGRWATNIVLVFAMIFALCIAPSLAQGAEGKNLKIFYKQNCAKCHGADGSAVSADGKKLKGEDFTNQEWQRDTSDDKMIKTILKGKFFGLAMPRYKKALTREEARLMVTGIIRKAQKGQVIAPDAE